MGAEAGPGGARAPDRQHRCRGDAALLRLTWRPYRFELTREMVTSRGAWSLRQGWLLRLEGPQGRVGWGEAALPPIAIATAEASEQGTVPAAIAADGSTPGPADPALRGIHPTDPDDGGQCGFATATPQSRRAAAALSALPRALPRETIESLLPALPAPLACALGMALAELDGLGSAGRGGWLAAPASALLLPAGPASVPALEQALAASEPPLTVKWKVASGDDGLEQRLLTSLLERLPADGRLRLDANGGWNRTTAWCWAERLAGEPRLDWLEQPLDPADREGLEALARRVPVALDESLRLDPQLMAGGWPGWQVRRPLVEGDPRPLLQALLRGTPRLMLSTGLETGIGRRFLHHLAGLQALGPTPTAPGLAPGWRPGGDLFSESPDTVWEAAG